VGLLIDLPLRFEPRQNFTHADVLFEAHHIRVARGDYNIAERTSPTPSRSWIEEECNALRRPGAENPY
jgi:hypothetical protein